MSIPLDRLYHYIQEIAEQVHGDNVLIYRFTPHGSKKIDDLSMLENNEFLATWINPEIICNDQEPLDYDMYDKVEDAKPILAFYKNIYGKNLSDASPNLRRYHPVNVYDKCLLLHSEKNSVEVQKYKNSHFIPVYYWSHAIIAQDWFRYAKHIDIKPSLTQKQFLIYNRAWAGTREYRLKFVELLQDHSLEDKCQVSFNPVDPESDEHFSNHVFKNTSFKPRNIKDSMMLTTATSYASADFTIDDYANTKIEVVLETLFDDNRIQLTEKILRPIACGHPFILASTPGSLEYLRKYGFKTFDGIIDESYDTVTDPVKRLESIVTVMEAITKWSDTEQQVNWEKIKKITQYNKEYFFSDQFNKLITDELKNNLTASFKELVDTNTSKNFIEFRKKYDAHIKDGLTPLQIEKINRWRTRNKAMVIKILLKARRYYNRYLKSLE